MADTFSSAATSKSRLAATTAFRRRNVHHKYAIVATITLHVAFIRPPIAHTNVAWPHTSRRTTCTLRFQSAVLWWAKKIGFSPVSGRAPLWSEGACGRDLRNKNKSSLRVVPNIITVPSSPLTHFYFTESTLNALYKVCMPCQNTCKMGSDRSAVGRSTAKPTIRKPLATH